MSRHVAALVLSVAVCACASSVLAQPSVQPAGALDRPTQVENFSLAPHLAGSISFLAGGVGLGLGALIAAVVESVRTSVSMAGCLVWGAFSTGGSCSYSANYDLAVGLGIAGTAALVTGVVWLAVALATHQRTRVTRGIGLEF